MISEREAYVYIQLPGTLETVPAARLNVQTLADGTHIGRFRYGDQYLARAQAVALDPYRLPLDKTVYEFTQIKGIPGALRDASPDAWGRRVIEHRLERADGDLHDETSTQLLRGQISALRGARNPHVQLRTFRFLCSVRLEL